VTIRRNYQMKFQALIALGILRLPQAGGVEEITVSHDPACPFYSGGDECTCDPDIYQNGKKLELPEGS
jgi:hypothetical protein